VTGAAQILANDRASTALGIKAFVLPPGSAVLKMTVTEQWCDRGYVARQG